MTSNGVGGALYQRVREVARSLGALGLFFECLPDDPEACSDPEYAKANAARLRFYERFGALPIVGTAYETPLKPGQLDLPHLVYDDLGSKRPLARADAQRVVRAILERRYSKMCTPEYNEAVVASIRDDPVQLRPKRYAKGPAPQPPPTAEGLVVLVVNDKHDIHHVRERGYVEAPVRVASILKGLEPSGLFLQVPAKSYPDAAIRAVHDKELFDYIKACCAKIGDGESVYPYVFPVRNATRPPKDMAMRAGYYCIDTFTPLNGNAYLAARRAVDCTLTAADTVLSGQRFAYALVRPPGHHAERRSFGGFCYFCNGAIAAQHLSAHGKVAILDVDYHHGNGQQDIFYRRSDVLTVSIHGHPSFAYPYFSGFAEELGEGEGLGFNLNLPQAEALDGKGYLRALGKALERIRAFAPRFLVVSLGLDVAKGDPTGSWSLRAADFEENGRLIRSLDLPTLVVQEGGYRTVSLGSNARAFFVGLTGEVAR
jgi:acetoin utilization deacetylase AcuC-like enzyme